MKNIKRQSAVQFEIKSLRVEERENWRVILEYQGEGDGPWLVDLGHKRRFDFQDKNIDMHGVDGITVPKTPGVSLWKNAMVVNRMNTTQASIYVLGRKPLEVKNLQAITEVTEATVFLALFGRGIFHITEKLTSLDFTAPGKKPPFLLQGPFCHVPCQIVNMQNSGNGAGGILLTCSRGYAESMIEAIMGAGQEFGLRPAGEDRFIEWLADL